MKVLVKTGSDVLVSVRRALGGTDLGHLREAVEREFLTSGRARAKCALGVGENGRRSHTAHGGAFTMTDESPNKIAKTDPSLSQEVGAKAARKLKARRSLGAGRLVRTGDDGADRLVGGRFQRCLGGARYLAGPILSRQACWTLALMMAGLAIGCFNAWHWVAKEDKEIRDEQEE